MAKYLVTFVKFSVISVISGVSGNSGESTWPISLNEWLLTNKVKVYKQTKIKVLVNNTLGVVFQRIKKF